MKKLYKFFWDAGRQGVVEGAFVAEEDEVEAAIGRDVYFGEILGKHSEIYGTLEDKDLTVLCEDQFFIEGFKNIVGNIGYNPLEYLSPDESEEGIDNE